MDATKSDELQQEKKKTANASQKKRNRNKSNSRGKPEAETTPEEISIEDAIKAVNLAPHQVQDIFHFISPLIIFMNV